MWRSCGKVVATLPNLWRDHLWRGCLVGRIWVGHIIGDGPAWLSQNIPSSSSLAIPNHTLGLWVDQYDSRPHIGSVGRPIRFPTTHWVCGSTNTIPDHTLGLWVDQYDSRPHIGSLGRPIRFPTTHWVCGSTNTIPDHTLGLWVDQYDSRPHIGSVGSYNRYRRGNADSCTLWFSWLLVSFWCSVSQSPATDLP